MAGGWLNPTLGELRRPRMDEWRCMTDMISSPGIVEQNVSVMNLSVRPSAACAAPPRSGSASHRHDDRRGPCSLQRDFTRLALLTTTSEYSKPYMILKALDKGYPNHIGFAMLRASGEECGRLVIFDCTEGSNLYSCLSLYTVACTVLSKYCSPSQLGELTHDSHSAHAVTARSN